MEIYQGSHGEIEVTNTTWMHGGAVSEVALDLNITVHPILSHLFGTDVTQLPKLLRFCFHAIMSESLASELNHLVQTFRSKTQHRHDQIHETLVSHHPTATPKDLQQEATDTEHVQNTSMAATGGVGVGGEEEDHAWSAAASFSVGSMRTSQRTVQNPADHPFAAMTEQTTQLLDEMLSRVQQEFLQQFDEFVHEVQALLRESLPGSELSAPSTSTQSENTATAFVPFSVSPLGLSLSLPQGHLPHKSRHGDATGAQHSDRAQCYRAGEPMGISPSGDEFNAATIDPSLRGSHGTCGGNGWMPNSTDDTSSRHRAGVGLEHSMAGDEILATVTQLAKLNAKLQREAKTLEFQHRHARYELRQTRQELDAIRQTLALTRAMHQKEIQQLMRIVNATKKDFDSITQAAADTVHVARMGLNRVGASPVRTGSIRQASVFKYDPYSMKTIQYLPPSDEFTVRPQTTAHPSTRSLNDNPRRVLVTASSPPKTAQALVASASRESPRTKQRLTNKSFGAHESN